MSASLRAVATIPILTFTLMGVWSPANAQSKSPPNAALRNAPAPSDDSHAYRNSSFAFRYDIPYGWVNRTREMREEETQNAKAKHASKSELLLAVFEHPPEVTANTINSGVVIATESVASYPGLKKAEDYVGPLSEITAAKGFKPDGDPAPQQIGPRQLVRVDFIKPLTEKLTMRQRTLILLAKGQIVSFTFIAASEDELDRLMDGLDFGLVKAASG